MNLLFYVMLTLTDKNEIAEAFAKYYEELYKDDPDNTDTREMEKYFEKPKLKQISLSQNTNLIKTVTQDEILQQIRKFKKREGFRR